MHSIDDFKIILATVTVFFPTFLSGSLVSVPTNAAIVSLGYRQGICVRRHKRGRTGCETKKKVDTKQEVSIMGHLSVVLIYVHVLSMLSL
jgi:hypothetical protein